MIAESSVVLASTVSAIITILLFIPIDKKIGISRAIHEHILQGIDVHPVIVLFSFVAVATVGIGTILNLVSISVTGIQIIYGIVSGLAFGIFVGLLRNRRN